MGGHNGERGTRHFWKFDLSAHLEGKVVAWENLPAWPGPYRFGALAEIMEMDDQPYLYLFSGKTETTEPRSQDNYLKDAYRFHISDHRWNKLSNLPHAVLIAPYFKPAPGLLIVLGGSDGHDIANITRSGSYRLPDRILSYNAAQDRWTAMGSMMLGVVGVPVIRRGTENTWILAGGEYSPALRTNRVFSIQRSN